MKRLVLLALIALYPTLAHAQMTQIATSVVVREQGNLGYRHYNLGLTVEGDYKLGNDWTGVGYLSYIHTPKVDSGTGNSYFGSLGARWSPLHWKHVEPFGEADFIMGALNTISYRKTVAHFRTGIGVRLLDRRLLLEVSRLFQDMLPDAATLLKERGQDVTALHTTFNQSSAWAYEFQYWTRPFSENSKWGAKVALRIQHARFVKNPFGDRGRAWWGQTEFGFYRSF